MLYVPYQGSDRCLHPLPLLLLPQCFALRSHQSTFSLSYWENDVASITLMLILQAFSPASPCFLYLTKCHAIPNHKGRIIPLTCCQRWCLLLLQPACGHFPIPGAIPYHAIPYQELQLLSIILSSMLLPSSLASLLGTMLVYCPFYPLHKTKINIIIHKFSKHFNDTI